jgi:hypothetical protein
MKNQIGIALVVVAGLSIAGCVDTVDPEITELELQSRISTDLPDVTLVRRVIPETGTKDVGFMLAWETEEVSSSEFGTPNDIADLGCIIEGIRESFREVNIVPTEMFWERMANQRESIELVELLSPPRKPQWQNLKIDVLVAAYHQTVDVESYAGGWIMFDVYGDIDDETAATLAIDLNSNKILQGSESTFKHKFAVGNAFVFIPLVNVTSASSSLCNNVGGATGAAIASTWSKSTPRVVVVAARNNPYTAAQVVIEKEKPARERAKLERECLIPFSEALQLDADIQGQQASSCRKLGQSVGWRWLCLAAHGGNLEAQHEMGRYFETSRDPVSKDMLVAYVWYKLAEANGYEESGTGSNYQKTAAGYECCYPDKTRLEILVEKLEPDQIAEAERLVIEWEPNPSECAIETAVMTD